jgi:hypothetical protein
MKIYTLLLVFLVTSISVLGQTNTVLRDTIPFRNDLGLIIISMSFNDVEKEFAFDTGAMKSVAFSWAEDELQRTSKRINVGSSSGSKTRMRFYKSGKINLGSKKISDHLILKVDDSPIFSCHNIDGILGVDITNHFNWEIDYKNKYLVMYEKNYFPEYVNTMSELDLTFKNDRPFVESTINGGAIKLLLDTGASDSDLNTSNYQITDIDEIPNSSALTGSYDVNGNLTQRESVTIRIPKVTSGDVTMTPVYAYSTSSSKIGNTLWKDKMLFLSLSNERLLVSESELKEESLEYSCGVIFYKGKLQIGQIYKDGTTWKQGVRQGDTVLEVNGMEFSNFCSFDTYQRAYTKTGKDFKILLKNGTELIVKKEDVLANH